jgi:hypothetical protein
MAALLLVLSLIPLHEFYLHGRADEVIELRGCLLGSMSPFMTQQRTLAVRCGNGSDAGFNLYQSARLSR